MDLLADLAEKTSEYMTLSDGTKDASLTKQKSISDKTLPRASVPVGNGEKGKNEKLEGIKDG
jgi:hypothetical protein